VRRSTLQLHEYAELPEAYYSDEKELAKLLEKQETPSVVLYDAANNKTSGLRAKFPRHKWVGLSDFSERWINPEG
jgi:membrane peptidoglycan carboxypeptidase